MTMHIYIVCGGAGDCLSEVVSSEEGGAGGRFSMEGAQGLNDVSFIDVGGGGMAGEQGVGGRRMFC